MSPRDHKQWRTAWHLGFANLVTERAPPGFEIRFEELLSLHPRRMDQLLLRRKHVKRRDGEARVMRGLWRHLGDQTILEFKSPSRGFRRGDLACLISYGYQYYTDHIGKLDDPSTLGLVLVVPTSTLALASQIARLRLTLEPLGDGYARLTGGLYTTFVVFLDEVANAERDEYVRIFTKHRDVAPGEAARWMQTWVMEAIHMGSLEQLEGYDEILAKLLQSLRPEQRLAGLRPEQRLAGLRPEQRLAGLDPQRVLECYDPTQLVKALHSLPEDVKDLIRQSLNGG